MESFLSYSICFRNIDTLICTEQSHMWLILLAPLQVCSKQSMSAHFTVSSLPKLKRLGSDLAC
jgi:hypothetical protein